MRVELDGKVVLLVAGAEVVVLTTATDVTATLLVVVVVVGLGRAGRPVVITKSIQSKAKMLVYDSYISHDGDREWFDKLVFCNSLLPWSSALQQTLKTTFMLCEEQRPPMRRCRSSRDDVAIQSKTIPINSYDSMEKFNEKYQLQYQATAKK